ncbi:MAG: DUF4249 domain-containing protein [Rikenellaceae bacterium]|nr:DUF4249 domain-containing protein [Rikenellaceae bacterium]
MRRVDEHIAVTYGRRSALWLLLCLLAGCTARLDISTADSDARLVVYGAISSDWGYQTVTLSSTSGFFSGETSPPVSGAEVSVTAGAETYRYYETHAGYYSAVDGFAGVEGELYNLTVRADLDGDGVPEIFRASTVMPPRVSIDSILIQESATLTDRYEILLWGEVPYEKGYYLSFSIARDQTPFNDSLSKYRIVEDRYFGSGYLEGFPCFFLTRESGDKLSDGDVVGMKVDVLPADYGKFLSDAKSELTGSILLFSGPPANVGTNIYQVSGSALGEPLGFFGSSASARSYTVFTVEPEYPVVPLRLRGPL